MVALVALASNATTVSQIEGEVNTLVAVRTTISMVVNAGTVWAGLAVVSGWLVRRSVQAFAAGVFALLLRGRSRPGRSARPGGRDRSTI